MLDWGRLVNLVRDFDLNEFRDVNVPWRDYLMRG